MTQGKELLYRYFLNQDCQIEGVRLIEDQINPDGIFFAKYSQEISPRTPGTHRLSGQLKVLPNLQIPVRLHPTGEILSTNPSLNAIDSVVIKKWSDYEPLPQND